MRQSYIDSIAEELRISHSQRIVTAVCVLATSHVQVSAMAWRTIARAAAFLKVTMPASIASAGELAHVVGGDRLPAGT
jgi:membrane-associated PAP2 superfamily phosphatase